LREFVAATIRFQQEDAEADMAGVRAGAAIAPSLPEMLFVHAHMVASKAVFVLILFCYAQARVNSSSIAAVMRSPSCSKIKGARLELFAASKSVGLFNANK
jgi:hypothetical protein